MMTGRFINIVLLFIFGFLIVSCSNDNQYETQVRHAESLMENNPDSAFAILNKLDAHKETFDKPLAMRFELQKASAQNSAYIPFSTDSVVKTFTSYYDKVGNGNQKVMAHYLLGCVYRDLGDSPQSMKCFMDAVERADTASNDCNYKLLSRVYGQLGMLYIDQELPNEAFDTFKRAEKYALLGKDTLMAIMCISQQSLVYEIRADLPRIISNAEYTSRLYKKYGYNAEAASSLGSAIQALVLSGQYSKAKEYINRYENNSGFFDSAGNIIKGREQYYYVKGLYYLGVKSDSAEHLFRKELRATDCLYNKMSAVYGLHEYYKENINKDSLLKYSEMLIELKDSVLNAKSTESIRKMSSLYKYSHIQKLAEKETQKAEHYRLVLIISIVLFLLIIIICVLLVLYLRIKDINRKKDAKALRTKYDAMLDLMNREKAELARIKDDKILKSKLIKDKEKYILELNKVIADLKSELSFMDCKNRENIDKQIKEKSVYIKFEKYANIGKLPSEADWLVMKSVFDDLFPQFKLFLSKHTPLKEDEYRLCILVRLCFSPKTIQSFLGISSSYVSVMRRRLCLKIFDFEGSPKEFDNKIRKIM